MPAPKTTHVEPGLDLRGVHRRADPGREPAREQARALERRLRRDLRECDLGHHGVLGERRRAHEVAHRLAVAREPRRAVGQVALVLLLADREAEVRAVAAAVHALAALRREERDDVVARRERRHAVADASRRRRRPRGRARSARSRTDRRPRRCRDRCGRRRTRRAGRAPRRRAARSARRSLHRERRAELLEDGGSDLHAAILDSRHRSEAPPAVRVQHSDSWNTAGPFPRSGLVTPRRSRRFHTDFVGDQRRRPTRRKGTKCPK